MPTLSWIGKDAVVNSHQQVPYRLLRCHEERSVGDAMDGNLLIEGDNLHALKALLPYYAGKVKCIYIDPPYNTGNEGWVYNDAGNAPEMKAWLADALAGQPVKVDDLSRHDKWLCMMYPRLVLLRQFLREDGVILVSIDDFEAAHLRCVMDEVFGGANFIAQLVWEKGRKNDAKLFSVGHEYMVVYAYSKETLRKQKTVWREPKPGAREIWDQYVELQKAYGSDNQAIETALQDWYKQLPKSHPSKALSRYKHIDKDGPWRDRDISWPGGGGPRYDVLHPVTKLPCKIPEAGWRFATPASMQRQIELGLVEFRADHTDPPFRKAHLRPVAEELDEQDSEEGDGQEEDSALGLQVMPSVIYKQSQVTVKHLRKLMGGKAFENPKDHEILARLIRYVTNPGDLVLDSFAGSGTTGHAVLKLNAEDGGNRRFILVEMEPKVAGPITAERLRRVIEGYGDTPGLGGGFRFCTLDEPLFDERGRVRWGVTFGELARHIFFTETGRPLPTDPEGEPPFIGEHDGVAYFLLWSGTTARVLDAAAVRALSKREGPKVVYAELCRVSLQRLEKRGITYKQIPYNIRTS